MAISHTTPTRAADTRIEKKMPNISTTALPALFRISPLSSLSAAGEIKLTHYPVIVDLDRRSWYIRTARCRSTNLGGTMRRITFVSSAVAFCLTAALAIGVTAARKPASPVADLPSGKVELQSAGALAFGPDGILFVGDSVGGSVVAIDTGDTKAMKAATINVQGVDAKIAALVGVTPDQIMINDVKVNPISKNVYLSGARGKGPDAMPLIVTRGCLRHGHQRFARQRQARLGQPGRRAGVGPSRPAEPPHADDHRHGLRERQPDGRRPVERRVVLLAALHPVSFQGSGQGRHASDLARLAWTV